MKSHRIKRLLSIALVAVMLLGTLPAAASAEGRAPSGMEAMTLSPIDTGTLQSRKLLEAEKNELLEREPYAATDYVRVSIVLDKASTIKAGFGIDNIAKNNSAMAYRDTLKSEQDAMIQKIGAVIVGGLNVKWKMTLAVNIISAEVMYGQIDRIRAIPGVAAVNIENRYELDAGRTGD